MFGEESYCETCRHMIDRVYKDIHCEAHKHAVDEKFSSYGCDLYINKTCKDKKKIERNNRKVEECYWSEFDEY